MRFSFLHRELIYSVKQVEAIHEAMNGTGNSTTSNPSSSIFVFIHPDVKTALYLSIFVLGLCGNAFVIKVVASKRSSRTFHDIFIFSLAISDLILLLIYFPTFFGHSLGQFKAPRTFCKLIWPLITVAYLSSIFIITSMAVHRSRVIVNPYTSEMSRRNIYIWISILWIMSFVCILPGVVFAEVNSAGMCYAAWPSVQAHKTFRCFMLVVQYLLPLTITAVAYIRIGLAINGSKGHRKHSRQPRALCQARRRENAQVVRTIATIVIIFAVCMFPKHLASLYYYFGENSPEKANILFRLLHISELFAVLHSCLNPLVYGTVMKHFRAEYVRYLKGIFCCRWNTRLGRIDSSQEQMTVIVEPRSSCEKTTPSEHVIHTLNTAELTTLSECKLNNVNETAGAHHSVNVPHAVLTHIEADVTL